MDDEAINKPDNQIESNPPANDNQLEQLEHAETQVKPPSDPNIEQIENSKNAQDYTVTQPEQTEQEPAMVETQPRPSPDPPPKTADSSDETQRNTTNEKITKNAKPHSSSPELTTGETRNMNYAELDITKLSDEQLKSAAALWAMKNQKSISQKGVQARQHTAQQNIANITKYISNHSPASNRTIARALNLPPRRVQHYMQILTKNGTVTATGWAQSRRYYKK